MPNIELTTATDQQKKDILGVLGAPQWNIDTNGNVAGVMGPDGTLVTGNRAISSAAMAGSMSRRINCSHPPYNAKFDGVTNDSAAIQAAIDAVAALGGGVVECPVGTAIAQVVLKENVQLVGAGEWFGYPAGSVLSTQIRSNTAGYVIDTPSSSILHAGVIGINVLGNGTLTATGGIRFRSVGWGIIKRCSFNNHSEEAIRFDSGCGACTIEDVLAVNCLVTRSRAAKIGVIDLSGADHFVSRVEATASCTALISTDLYICAFVIRGANNFIDRCIGEISEIGFHLVSNSSSLNSLTGCRADLNFGPGFDIHGPHNDFSACRAVNNSRHLTNTYSGWVFDQTFGGNTLAACHSYSNIATVHKYGFEDFMNSASVGSRNEFVGCRSQGHGTRAFFTENFAGSGPVVGAHVSLQNTGTTFDVGQTSLLRPGHSSGAVITDMVNGQQGQTVRIVGNVNITMQNNSVIKNTTGADRVLAANRIYTYTRDNGVWYES